MRFMTFDAPLPPGDRAAGEGLPPGRRLAQLLADGVARAGLPIVEGLAQHDAYGWSFVVDAGGGRHVWCMLQLSDNWLVIVKAETPLLRRLFGAGTGGQALQIVSAALRAAAQGEPTFSNVRWFDSEAEFRRSGP